jgi:hypothetical protein
MQVYELNPLKDARWDAFLIKHPRSSVFHSTGWLEALRTSYGYEPIVFTTAPPGVELSNGLVACVVQSWLTGRRLVSLPFSDFCDPLFESPEEFQFLIKHFREILKKKKWNYVELRPLTDELGQIAEQEEYRSSSFYFSHRLDLRADTGTILKSFDKDSVQRRIRRAERAGLTEEHGRTSSLLKDFYGLMIVTRKRHHVPPQPYVWFENLMRYLGEALEIWAAYKDGIPVASILTLQFKDTVYYKYGCSDARFNNLGATPLLLWRTIAQAKLKNAMEFDFGRTEKENASLVAFKDKWAPRSKPIIYLRFPQNGTSAENKSTKFAGEIFGRMPEKLLVLTGNLIYRHIG